MILLFVGWLAYFSMSSSASASRGTQRQTYWCQDTHLVDRRLVAAIEGPLVWRSRWPNSWTTAWKAAVVLRVAAQQFQWNARYPGLDRVFGKQDIKLVSSTNQFGVVATDPAGKDDFGALNSIHVPVNKPVVIHLTSMDVIHSFKVIALRVCQDAIPGLSIPVWFKAKPGNEGKYQINCAQLCGNGHANMAAGFITIESQDKFDTWYAQQSKGGGATATSFE